MTMRDGCDGKAETTTTTTTTMSSSSLPLASTRISQNRSSTTSTRWWKGWKQQFTVVFALAILCWTTLLSLRSSGLIVVEQHWYNTSDTIHLALLNPTTKAKPTATLFMERLNRLLPPTCKSLPEGSLMPCVSEEQDRRLFPEDIAKLEKEIMAFNIPRQVIVDVDDSEYLSLVHWRWKIMVDEQRPIEEQMCPNCLVRHTTTNAGMNQTSREDMLSTPGDVKFNDFCPTHMRENFKDHEHQITVSGCGESQAGSGGMYATHGRVHYDLHSSFENLGTDFHKSYAHLHLSPPEPKYANFTELYSVTDFARALLRPPPSTREGDARGEEATFIHNNCGSKRGQLVSEIIASNEVGVARYGSCFNNFQGSEKYYPKSFYFGDSEGTRDSTKTILSSLHKFTFSLENTFSRDYFTEKRYQALLAGSVPIVWTNDNSLDFLPDPDSSFLVDPNNINAREIAIQLRTIAANETAYNEFFAWKKRGLRASFVRVLFLSTDFLTCRYCEYAAFKHPQSKTRPNGES